MLDVERAVRPDRCVVGAGGREQAGGDPAEEEHGPRDGDGRGLGDAVAERRHELRPELLNRDDEGRVKCVACFLCATACPAHCIDIVATESPWPDREKYPESFHIDELRCIFCGMCEEACPVDAIELTSLLDLTGKSREEMIFDKEKLLSVYDMTKDAEPMKSAAMGGTL